MYKRQAPNRTISATVFGGLITIENTIIAAGRYADLADAYARRAIGCNAACSPNYACIASTTTIDIGLITVGNIVPAVSCLTRSIGTNR